MNFDFETFLSMVFSILSTVSNSVNCNYDWLEVEAYVNGHETYSGRFCGNIEAGKFFNISAHNLVLRFHTDHKNEADGFWIKYNGIKFMRHWKLFSLVRKDYACANTLVRKQLWCNSECNQEYETADEMCLF